MIIQWIAVDFGISEAPLNSWIRRAEVEDSKRPGQTAGGAAEARELTAPLEQDNEV